MLNKQYIIEPFTKQELKEIAENLVKEPPKQRMNANSWHNLVADCKCEIRQNIYKDV